MNYFKKIKNIIFFVILLIFSTSNLFSKTVVLDKIIAIVNNETILLSDLNHLINEIKKDSDFYILDQKDLEKDVLKEMILDKIILENIKKNKIKISEEEVDNVILNDNLKINPFYEKLNDKLKEKKISYAKYKEAIKKSIEASVLYRKLFNKIYILEEEKIQLKKFFKEKKIEEIKFNIDYILLTYFENMNTEEILKKEKLAKKLIYLLKKGNNLKKLYNKEISKDEIKIFQQNEATINEVPTLFVNFLKSAKEGDIIGPINSDVGYYILKVKNIFGKQKIVSPNLHIKHILLKTSPIINEKQAYQKLFILLKKINNKTISFENAAEKFSEDYVSSKKGGDLGWNQNILFDSIFQDALSKVKKEEITYPIRSSFGWHLIKLVDIKELDVTKETEKQYIHELVSNQRLLNLVEIWSKEQKSNAYIKIF